VYTATEELVTAITIWPHIARWVLWGYTSVCWGYKRVSSVCRMHTLWADIYWYVYILILIHIWRHTLWEEVVILKGTASTAVAYQWSPAVLRRLWRGLSDIILEHFYNENYVATDTMNYALHTMDDTRPPCCNIHK